MFYWQNPGAYGAGSLIGHDVEWKFELLRQGLDQAFELVSSGFEVLVRPPDQRLMVLGTVRRIGSDFEKTMLAD